MVTGGADREGLSPEIPIVGIGRRFRSAGRQHPSARHRRARKGDPGSQAASSLTLRVRVNRGDPSVGAEEWRTRRQAIKRKGAGSGRRKSEVLIVALRPGNAGGAKEHRFGELVKGNIA